MEYKRFGNTIFARLDRGEEILEQLKILALQENIKLASVRGLGAVDEFTVGVFKTDRKQYDANSFTGYFEIVSLTGTITTMDGEYYAHLHMSAGNEKGVRRTSESGDDQRHLRAGDSGGGRHRGAPI